MQVPSMHAVVVGSDMSKQTKYESELRNYVIEKKIQDHVHFVNKTLTVAPYLASIDVLVQNSQVQWNKCSIQVLVRASSHKKLNSVIMCRPEESALEG